VLAAKGRIRSGSEVDEYCSLQLTTQEARSVAEALEDAGLEPDPEVSWVVLQYRLSTPDGSANVISIRFEPYLPHGEWTCSTCDPSPGF
jgi:hypothetical protein